MKHRLRDTKQHKQCLRRLGCFLLFSGYVDMGASDAIFCLLSFLALTTLEDSMCMAPISGTCCLSQSCKPHAPSRKVPSLQGLAAGELCAFPSHLAARCNLETIRRQHRPSPRSCLEVQTRGSPLSPLGKNLQVSAREDPPSISLQNQREVNTNNVVGTCAFWFAQTL